MATPNLTVRRWRRRMKALCNFSHARFESQARELAEAWQHFGFATRVNRTRSRDEDWRHSVRVYYTI